MEAPEQRLQYLDKPLRMQVVVVDHLDPEHRELVVLLWVEADLDHLLVGVERLTQVEVVEVEQMATWAVQAALVLLSYPLHPQQAHRLLPLQVQPH
jgi:hypothetical protein